MECVLCTDTCRYFGLTECEHKSVCSLCWYRLKAIIQKDICPVCRSECKQIFIVSDQLVSFESISSTRWGDSYPGFIYDELSDLFFRDKNELSRLISFRKLVCKECNQESHSFPQFKQHLQSYHNLKLCDQCLKHNKLFPGEQELYDEEGFRAHITSMHVKCNVCNVFFYDGSQLVAHIKSQHHFCGYCPIEKRVAYLDYQQLEEHYRKTHYFCTMQRCRESKHIVFIKYEDFQEHYKRYHPGLNIPPPVFSFRLKEEEEENKEMRHIFEDNPGKDQRNIKPEIKRNDFDFPALAPPSNEKRILDYTRIINNNPIPKQPTVIIPKNKKEPQRPKTSKKEEKAPKAYEPSNFYDNFSQRKDSPKKNQKNELTPLEDHFNSINNSLMTAEQFVSWFRNEKLILDNNMILEIRNKILSNSEREKIIYLLQQSPNEIHERKNQFEEVKLKNNPYYFEENKIEHVISDRNIEISNKQNISNHIFNTVLENIVILNSGLINNSIFVNSLMEFIPQDRFEQVYTVIREKVIPGNRANEVIKMIQAKLANSFVNREYPALPNNEKNNSNAFYSKPMISKPEINRKYENTLKENINLFNS